MNNIKKIHAFGDSFVSGDQDDFKHDHHPKHPPIHGMEYHERDQYLKNNVSFIALVAKHFGYDFENYSDRGSGNMPQIDRLLLACKADKIKPNDMVFFGMTTFVRDRLSVVDVDFIKSTQRGSAIIDKAIIKSDDRNEIVIELDIISILLLIDNIARKFNFQYKCMYLFDNVYTLNFKNPLYERIEFPNLIGHKVRGNTTIDIINDTWGKGLLHEANMHILDVKPEYEQFYTAYRHPSVLGHQKIASWLINNVDWTQ
jgi:hypothetical protein